MVYFPYFGGGIMFLHGASYQYHKYILQDAEFVYEQTVANDDGTFTGDFIWTNHDIRRQLDDYTLGEVVYAASEPIPVYE
jgi:hypothetical protein